MNSKIMMLLVILTVIHGVCFTGATGHAAQEEFIEFDSDRWILGDAEVTEYMGRKCLRGNADLKNVQFRNGVIEFDLLFDGTPSYPGIVFRKQSEADTERFYIRPHRTTGYYTEALQYTPVFNNVAGWQLYSGEGFTTGASLPANEWVHVRVEVLGYQARVFLNEEDQPALEIPELKHGDSSGGIGILSQRTAPAYFSNFRYEERNDLDFAPPPETAPVLGMITDWEISSSYPLSMIDLERTPGAQGLTDMKWQKVQTDKKGLVDIARYRQRSGPATDCVFARTTITSDMKEKVLNLRFGYSDAVSVFLNGKLLFFGNSAYRQRDPSFQGIIGLNDAVYLYLEKGRNELLLCVAESFGGWGFMCQDGNMIFEHDKMRKQWELARTLNYPESVVYDPERDVLYVSNNFNNGNEFISKVKLDGEIEELEWVSGLNRPTGLWIKEDKLFAIERSNLVEIDIASGEIIDRFPVPASTFLNDVAFDDNGYGYITDTQGNAIHRFHDGVFEIWLQGGEITNPNGLYFDGERLIVGTSGDASVKAIDIRNKKITNITSLESGSFIDGLRGDGRGNYIISDYNGRVFHVTKTGEKTELLNTTVPPYFCADLEYIPEKKLLVIPTLFDNRLMTYRFNG